MEDSEIDNLFADQELRNWAAWIRSIPSPIPRASASGIAMFRDLRSRYPDDDDVKVRVEPDFPRAEVCEVLLCEHFKADYRSCFYASYVLEMNNRKAADYLNEDDHKRTKSKKRKFNKDSYNIKLSKGITKLAACYELKIGVVTSHKPV